MDRGGPSCRRPPDRVRATWEPATDVAGTDYVDGGVHSPTNADVLADLHLDLVVISSAMSLRPRDARARLDLPLRLVFHGYLCTEVVWALRRRGDRVITIEPDA